MLHATTQVSFYLTGIFGFSVDPLTLQIMSELAARLWQQCKNRCTQNPRPHLMVEAIPQAIQISTTAELYESNAITLCTSAFAAARSLAGSVDKIRIFVNVLTRSELAISSCNSSNKRARDCLLCSSITPYLNICGRTQYKCYFLLHTAQAKYTLNIKKLLGGNRTALQNMLLLTS